MILYVEKKKNIFFIFEFKFFSKKAFEEFRKEVLFMIGLRHVNIVCMLAFSTKPR